MAPKDARPATHPLASMLAAAPGYSCDGLPEAVALLAPVAEGVAAVLVAELEGAVAGPSLTRTQLAASALPRPVALAKAAASKPERSFMIERKRAGIVKFSGCEKRRRV